ncbi:MAG: HAMP domain-containing sensor histidine kinase [Kiritimatiellia bacterium]
MAIKAGKSRKLLSFAVYLATGYLAVYAICTVIMLYLGNRVISQSTRNFDKQDVAAESEELTELMESNPSGNWLAEELALEKYPPSTIFAMRVITTLGHIEYEARTPSEIVIPGWESIGSGPVLFPELGWKEIPLSEDERIIQMKTTQLDDGRILQIAKGSLLENKQKQLLSKNLTLFMLFSLALTLFATLFMIYITLRPITQITQSMRHIIKTGAFESNPPPVRSMISELDRLGSQFNVMTKKYADLIQAMRETMDNVAHDIRTPLSRIRGTSELAIKSGRLPEELADTLADIIDDCDHACLQLQNLLDTREMESGFVRIDTSPFSFSSVVHTLTDMYSLIAEENEVTLKVRSPDKDIIMEGDKNRISRIFSNIIDNALKYTPKSGKVEINILQEKTKVIVSIADSGIGIPADEIALIWQRLYRSERARELSKGLGLGMNIVKIFTEAHHGSVNVKSSEQGTTFTVILPLKQSD